MTAPYVDVPQALELLRHGTMTIRGRIVEASNATLLCEISLGEHHAHCVYKPVRGERPLWDFPEGTLAGREVAAYEVSVAGGWNLIPPTILRDGEFGPGMVQLWVDGDEEVNLVEFARCGAHSLRRLAVLDAVINNSDRKGGHLIPIPADVGRALPLVDRGVYGVDHGVTFNVDDKLRTILWMWAGDPLTDEALGVLDNLRAALDAELGVTLREHITEVEVQQTVRRVEDLLKTGTHPMPSEDWPAFPYPPF